MTKITRSNRIAKNMHAKTMGWDYNGPSRKNNWVDMSVKSKFNRETANAVIEALDELAANQQDESTYASYLYYVDNHNTMMNNARTDHGNGWVCSFDCELCLTAANYDYTAVVDYNTHDEGDNCFCRQCDWLASEIEYKDMINAKHSAELEALNMEFRTRIAMDNKKTNILDWYGIYAVFCGTILWVLAYYLN